MDAIRWWGLSVGGALHYHQMPRDGGSPRKVWPVALTEPDAVRLGEHLNLSAALPTLVGVVGSPVVNESIRLARASGCSSVMYVLAWNFDGSPVVGHFDLREPVGVLNRQQARPPRRLARGAMSNRRRRWE